MNDVELKIDETKRGAFVIEEGKMRVHLDNNDLIVEGTEVDKKFRGRNIGKKLLEAMVHHARKNNYMVVPLCPFVRGQFERHPEAYRDIWKRVVV